MQIVQIALANEVKQALDDLKNCARELHAEVEADIFREMQRVVLNVPSNIPPPILGRPKLLKPEIPRDQLDVINAVVARLGINHPRVVKMRDEALAAVKSEVEETNKQRAERKVLMSPNAKAKRMREETAQRRAKVLDQNPELAARLDSLKVMLTNSSLVADALLIGLAELKKKLTAPKGFTKKKTTK